MLWKSPFSEVKLSPELSFSAYGKYCYVSVKLLKGCIFCRANLRVLSRCVSTPWYKNQERTQVSILRSAQRFLCGLVSITYKLKRTRSELICSLIESKQGKTCRQSTILVSSYLVPSVHMSF